jgi:hypothetical protein
MSLYQNYLFVQPPLGKEVAGLPAVAQGSRFAYLRDLADLVEMFSRRHMVSLLSTGTDLARTPVADIRADWEKRGACNRFPDGAATQQPSVACRLPGALSGGKFDAADMLEMSYRSYNTTLFTYLGPLIGWYSDYERNTGVFAAGYVLENLRHGLMGGDNSLSRCAFLDGGWEPDGSWGAEATGTRTWKEDYDGNVVEEGEPSIARYSVPARSYFLGVADAVYARALRGPVPYSYVDDNGQPQTVGVKVPWYLPWYDPEGEGCYHALGGGSSAKMRTWGKFAGSKFPYHTEAAFTFDYVDGDPAQDLSNLQYIAPPDPSACLASSNHVYPPLRTPRSWWEDAGLGLSDGNAAGEADRNVPAGPCLDAVKSFYAAPSLTPSVVAGANGTFPAGQGWTPTDGQPEAAYPRFNSPFPFAAAFAHAYEFMRRLHKVCIKVDYIRAWFSSSREEHTVDYGKEYSGMCGSPDIEERTSHNRNRYGCSGWIDLPAAGETTLHGGGNNAFGGFSLRTNAPDGASSTGTATYESHQSSPDCDMPLTNAYTLSLSSSSAVTKIVPLARQGSSYDYTYSTETDVWTDIGPDDNTGDTPPAPYHYGPVQYRNNYRETAAAVPLIPDWAMPFVRSAELLLACEGTLSTHPGPTGTVAVQRTEGGEEEISGSMDYSENARRVRKVVSLGTVQGGSGASLEFTAPVNLESLLDSVIPSGGAQLSARDVTGGVHPVRNGTHTTTYGDYHSTSGGYEPWRRTVECHGNPTVDERALGKVSLFLVVDFDPDADVRDPWGQD